MKKEDVLLLTEILAVMDPDNKLLKFMNQSPTKFEKYAKNKKVVKYLKKKNVRSV